ncbi:hypothetical protein D081_0243 [Anaerovibrio sp. JC8]|nr:hypothetical protein D081_0243 [Anaerovibrio sp. JC8]
MKYWDFFNLAKYEFGEMGLSRNNMAYIGYFDKKTTVEKII